MQMVGFGINKTKDFYRKTMLILLISCLLSSLAFAKLNEGWFRLSFDLSKPHPTNMLTLDLPTDALVTFTGCACANEKIHYEIDGKSLKGERKHCKSALCPTDIDWTTFGCNVDWKTCIGHLNVPAGKHNLTAILIPSKVSIGEVFYRIDSLCRSMEDEDAKADAVEMPCCKIQGQCNENISY